MSRDTATIIGWRTSLSSRFLFPRINYKRKIGIGFVFDVVLCGHRVAPIARRPIPTRTLPHDRRQNSPFDTDRFFRISRKLRVSGGFTYRKKFRKEVDIHTRIDERFETATKKNYLRWERRGTGFEACESSFVDSCIEDTISKKQEKSIRRIFESNFMFEKRTGSGRSG